jgi:hypothetical protein
MKFVEYFDTATFLDVAAKFNMIFFFVILAIKAHSMFEVA